MVPSWAGSGTREVAQARMKDAMDAVQAQMNSGLEKLAAEEAKLAVAKIKALRAKFMANEDLKEKVKGVLQGYLKSKAHVCRQVYAGAARPKRNTYCGARRRGLDIRIAASSFRSRSI